MKLLLDTHILLWWMVDPNKIANDALVAIRDTENEVYISSAVLWEIAIKRVLGKLSTPDDILDVLKKSGFQILPIEANHALATETLPLHHRDPFDRMLVAQSILENATLITKDATIELYSVPIIRG